MKTEKQVIFLGWLLGIWLLAGVFAMTAQANTPAQPVEEGAHFLCLSRLHSHTAQCFHDSGRQICMYADFFVHSHGEDCYDGSGNLLCPLPEIATHIHGEDCYGPMEADASQPILWRQVLLCPRKEIRLHTHKDACLRDGKWICGKQQVLAHQHGEGCFRGDNIADSRLRWLGIGQVELKPFTKAALAQMAVGVSLLALQARLERKKLSLAAK